MPNSSPCLIRGWALSLITSCLLMGIASPAIARQTDGERDDGEVARAEEKAAAAFQAYESKRYTEAVALYTEAYDAAPNADILYNLARIYDTKLGDRQLALSFYRRYVADPGAVADRIEVANQRLALLREAEIAATRPSERATAEAPLAQSAPAPAPPLPPGATEPGWSGPEAVGVIMLATGVVALGVGTGFGVAAMSETRTARDLCTGNVCREQRGIDAADSASDHALVSTIGLASGGVLFALGAALYLWSGDEPDEAPLQALESTSQSGVQLGAHVSPNRGGFSLGLGGAW